ncbi:MAG: GNAT family N-acetyltransferase [Gemmobacter sp.]
MRRAEAGDAVALDAYLAGHPEGSMFPRANLARHGLEGSDDPHATWFWVVPAPDGALRAAVGVTGAGMVLPQMAGALPADWAELRAALRGVPVTGVVGPAAQVRRVVEGLRLEGAATRHDATEPGFALDLADLAVPLGADDGITPASAADAGVLCDWRTAYQAEVLGAGAAEAGRLAQRDIEGYLAAGSHRVLWRGGQPVAFCGFNAALPDIVQVGGVWVPPDLRGQGLARRAVALHLAEARDAGVRRACLFAASEAAERAYRAIGFGPAAPMALVLFRAPQVVA